jgi:outer membrane protein OmpA-like peptidoglycan-associated protein
MKQLFYLFLFFSIISNYNAQTYKEQYATKLSSELRFVEALPVWEELSNKTLNAKEKNWDNVRKAVEAAYNSEQYEKAYYWSQKLTASSAARVNDWTTYFNIIQITKRHSRLVNLVDSACQRFPQNTQILNWKNNVSQILKQLSEKSEYSISNFRQLKTGEEFCAVPYQGGYILVSNRRNTGFVNHNYPWTDQHFLDLIAINGETDIQKDQLWKEIKRSNPHDGPIAFSNDNKIAALTINQEEIDKSGGVKFSRLMLKIYRLTDGKWSEGELFPFNNKTYSVGHGVFDQEGNLIFASDKPGGFGESDLYKSTWKDGVWSTPINLGEKINTSNDELFPFVSNNGTLYFSSNGWPGNGGLDVFYQNEINSNPVHIGNPINTNADDFGIYINEITGKGNLSSNRNNFKDEVFNISKPVYKIDAEISLTTCDNKPLTNKSVIVKNLKTAMEQNLTTDESGKITFNPTMNSSYRFEYVGEENLEACSAEKIFDSEGKIQINLSSTYKNFTVKLTILDGNDGELEGAQLTYYSKGKSSKKALTNKENPIIELSAQEIAETDSIVASKINYFDSRFILSENGDCKMDKVLTLSMQKRTDSELIKLENIYYDFDLWNLRPEGKLELDKLVRYMQGHPELTVELGSHTDSRGTAIYNVWLAEQRSNSCVNYIKSKGISEDKIIAKGYGESQLVNKCADGVDCTEEEHQRNRRTVLNIKILPTIK